MDARRSLAYGCVLAVALAAAGGAAFLALRDAPGEAGAGGVAGSEAVARAEPEAVSATLAGRGDERPLRAATLEGLLERLKRGEGDDHDAAVAELRTRAAQDADLVRRLVERLRGRDLWTALQALVAIGAPAAVPLAECALAAGEERGGAIFEALRSLGAEAAAAVPLLHERLLASDDPHLRVQLIGTLGAIGPQAAPAVPTLLGLLEPPLDDDVAGVAAEAVARIAGATPEVLAALRTVLLDEETLSRPGALAAVAILGPGASSFRPFLIDLLEDPEDATRLGAAGALGALGGADGSVLDALTTMLVHDHAQGRQAAARALVALGPAGVDALARAAAQTEAVDARLSAVEVLAGIAGRSGACAAVLVSVLGEECDKGWKKRALGLLARLDPPPAAAAVLPALRSCLDDPTLAADAIRVVPRLGGEEARGILTAALSGEDGRGLATAVLDAVAFTPSEDPSRDALVVLALGPDMPREVVVRALDRLRILRPRGRAAAILPALEPWLASDEVNLRVRAYGALPWLDGEEATRVRRLLEGLRDEPTRESCATSLSFLPAHASQSVPALVDALLALPESAQPPHLLFWATVRLANGWPGARAWLQARRDGAGETERARIDEVLARLSP